VDYVVATDSIGMGLNLPIDNVAFFETDKFDGEQNRALTHSEIRQIAGRAGRDTRTGQVYCFSRRDHQRIQQALASHSAPPTPPRLPAAPHRRHIESIAQKLPGSTLFQCLQFFVERIRFVDSPFVANVQSDTLDLAWHLNKSPLSIQQNFILACVPITQRVQEQRWAWDSWVGAVQKGQPAKRYNSLQRVTDRNELQSLETQLKIETAYLWLSQRMPELFPDGAQADRERGWLNERINERLSERFSARGLRHQRCTSCGRNLLPRSPYPTCVDCKRTQRDHR
jgi:ATP-dependent RNA helicase SUPV3L1/SUV3